MDEVRVESKRLTVVEKKKFYFVDTAGMYWMGDVHTERHGPKDYYEMEGTVTTGPEEWKELRITLRGQYTGGILRVTPTQLTASVANNQSVGAHQTE